MSGFFTLTVRPRLQALALFANVVVLGGIIGFPNTMRFDFWQPRTANGNAVIQDTSGNTMLTITDAGTTGNVMATGDVSSGAGHVFTVPSGDVYLSVGPTANAVLHLRAGSAGGVATSYADLDLNGIQLQNNAKRVSSASTKDLELNAASGQRVRFLVNGTALPFSCSSSQCDTADISPVVAFNNGGITIGAGGTQSSAINWGSITLVAGSGTASVSSGQACVCTDATANVSVKCAVASTTLTATGTSTDVIKFWCFK